jgi:signal recognition particle subunit SRP54
MFDSLTSKLGDVFDSLTRRGALREEDVNTAMREVRVALLEADVALPVVKDFVAQVKARAVGEEVLRSVTPGQQVIKIVNDALVDTLGREVEPINLAAEPPAVILMVGLQGSGKTTTSAKIGYMLQGRERKKVMLASLDTRRPAAQEQLRVLGEQAEVPTLPIVEGEGPVKIAKRALKSARSEGFDVLILDTAGRLHIDQELMDEVAEVSKVASPVETLLVADAMTGQDAVTIAQEFNEKVGVTGVVLTRVDGDARGGAALSMRAVTGRPIKLMGMGEKLDALEPFHPNRIASRILGMGDVVSLVEKAAETFEQDEAEKLAKKLQKGNFDFSDMLMQLRQMKKMGGLGGLMNLLPGVGKMKKQLAAANMDESMLGRQEAIILSMTPRERAAPKIIHASRKKRIAAGSGTTVQEINKLIKQWQEMNKVMKRMKKMGGKFDPSQLPPDLRAQLEQLDGGAPGAGMPSMPGGLPGGLPGMPKGFKP